MDVYEMPYAPQCPVICMDEKPYQLLEETKTPLPMRPGDTQKTDSEYVRNGTCIIFVFTEPLAGWAACNCPETAPGNDWTKEIRHLLDECYPGHKKIILVMDNLNIHTEASLYKRYKPDEARRLAKRLEIHHMPVHGSRLNIAEIELNTMTRQCLTRRIDTPENLNRELGAWEQERTAEIRTVNWHFKSGDAREKLKSLYPKLS